MGPSEFGTGFLASKSVFGPKTTFYADQASRNIDYHFNIRDRIAGKCYYQNDPTVAHLLSTKSVTFRSSSPSVRTYSSFRTRRTVRPTAPLLTPTSARHPANSA